MSEEIQKVDEPIIDSNPHVEDQVTPATTDPEVDYKTKFSESSKEALRLLEETKAKDAEIERLKQLTEQGANNGNDPDNIYPGFEQLTEDEQKNLVAYTEGIKRKALAEIKKDPAIAFARESYNERKWDTAFDKVAIKFPELKQDSEFKSKYFRVDNVPENIENLLEDIAKIHLFDHAREIGAKDAIEKANRIDIERQQAGDKTPTATRSLEDWHKLAQSDPGKFAKLSKEYNSDLESGKLK